MIELNPNLCTGSNCQLYNDCKPCERGWIERGKVGDRKGDCEEVRI